MLAVLSGVNGQDGWLRTKFVRSRCKGGAKRYPLLRLSILGGNLGVLKSEDTPLTMQFGQQFAHGFRFEAVEMTCMQVETALEQVPRSC